MQDELDSILSMANASSLDVERSIALARRSEQSRLISVSRASRNDIIRRYNSIRWSQARAKKAREVRKARQQKHINKVALALRRRPDLVRVVPKAGARPSLQLDRQALKRYVAANDAVLTEEVAQARAAAAAAEVAGDTPTAIPLSNDAWLQWLEQNEEVFRHHLRTAAASRRPLNVRRPWTLQILLLLWVVPCHGMSCPERHQPLGLPNFLTWCCTVASLKLT